MKFLRVGLQTFPAKSYSDEVCRRLTKAIESYDAEMERQRRWVGRWTTAVVVSFMVYLICYFVLWCGKGG